MRFESGLRPVIRRALCIRAEREHGGGGGRTAADLLGDRNIRASAAVRAACTRDQSYVVHCRIGFAQVRPVGAVIVPDWLNGDVAITADA